MVSEGFRPWGRACQANVKESQLGFSPQRCVLTRASLKFLVRCMIADIVTTPEDLKHRQIVPFLGLCSTEALMTSQAERSSQRHEEYLSQGNRYVLLTQFDPF